MNGRHLYYVDEGAGSPLILSHGWGFDHGCFRPLIDQLSERHRVIAYDIRGHGRSERSAQAYTMAQLASDLVGLIAALHLPEPPVVLGHSLGGAVVQQLLVDHPGAARAAVILDSDLNTGPSRLLLAALTRLSTPAMRIAASLLGQERSLGLYPPLLDPLTYSRTWRKANHAAVREEATRFVARNNIDDLIWSLQAWATRPSLQDALARRVTPVLLMRGDQDLIVSRAKLSRLSRSLPGSQQITVERAGHAIAFERPGVVAKAVADFVSQLPPWSASAAA